MKEIECTHRWRKICEEFLLGGSFPIGYRCVDCGKYVSNSELTPSGIGGVVLKEVELVGPHGGRGNTSDGRVYIRQVVNFEKKTLTIEFADGTTEIMSI